MIPRRGSPLAAGASSSNLAFAFFDMSAIPYKCNRMGNDPFVDAAESASFPLPGTGKREGGKKMQPLHHISSHLGIRGGVPTEFYAVN